MRTYRHRIAIDATPAITQRAGVGRYARELIRALVALPVDDQFVLAAAANSAATNSFLRDLPPGAWREIRRLPAAERLMTIIWQRLHAPIHVERFIGEFDVFHGTDFILPPSNKPEIVTIHDLSYVRYPEFAHPDLVEYLRVAVPRAIERAAAIITVSSSMAAELAEIYPQAQHRIVAIPNGINVPTKPGTQDRNSERPRILIVGTVEPRKNHLTVLAAMNGVWEQFPDACLHIVGRTGWKSDEIARAIHKAEKSNRVLWIDQADDDVLEREYREADVFVYPSHYEGFGLPVLEAMARGLPVVSSTAQALVESAGDVAMYVDPNDPESLAATLLQLLVDSEMRTSLGERGRLQSAPFTWRACAERTHRVYRMIAEHGGL